MFKSIISELPDNELPELKYFTRLREEKGEDLNDILHLLPKLREELPKDSKPVSIPKEETKQESKISYNFSSKEDFKSTMLPIYENILLSKGLNPLFAKSLVAQDGLESAWGRRPSGSNNFGGIKSRFDKKTNSYIDPGTLIRTREVVNGKDVYEDAMFRDFGSLEEYALYKVNLLNSNRYKAFSGDLNDFSRRVSSGGYATDPRYKEVLDKVIKSVKKGGKIEKANLGTILSTNEPISQRRPGVGVLRNDYFGKDKYDYSMSPEIPEDGGHWPSRDPYTGLLLKSKYHPTINKEYEESKRLGLKLYEDRNGRQYTLEEWQDNMPEYILKGLKEIDYPMLPSNPFDSSIGQYMSGHTSEEEYLKYLPYNSYFSNAAKEFGLPEGVLIHLASTESHFDSSAKNNATGAEGIMQIMPKSLQNFKNSGKWNPELTDEENNIRAGAYILKYFYDVYKDWGKALMAYKGISKDKMSPSHPDYESVINDNKINYLLQYANSK